MKSKKRVWVGWTNHELDYVFTYSPCGTFIWLNCAITKNKRIATPNKIRITVEELPCKKTTKTKKPTK